MKRLYVRIGEVPFQRLVEFSERARRHPSDEAGLMLERWLLERSAPGATAEPPGELAAVRKPTRRDV
jgi:hypothetical protein